MEEDLKDFPGLPRLTYYAGVLRYDLAMAADATRAATVTLGREAVKILQRRAKDAGKSQEEKQQRLGIVLCTNDEENTRGGRNCRRDGRYSCETWMDVYICMLLMVSFCVCIWGYARIETDSNNNHTRYCNMA